MSEEKNIINYTAADIEKYWNGKLSTAEMHAIEKAAMDDPFLADALEGYKNADLAGAGLDELKEKLDKRVGAFVPAINLKRKRFTWIRAAAAIIIIVGAGLLVQQLFFNDRNKNSIALSDSDKKQAEAVPKSDPLKPDTIYKNIQTVTADSPTKSELKTSLSATVETHAFTPLDTNKKTGGSDLVLQKNKAEDVTAGLATFAIVEKKNEEGKDKAVPGKTTNDTTILYSRKKDVAATAFAKPQAKQANDEADRFGNLALNNSYNYRVVDAQNNPVPFANVLNTRDNVGTYTDIRGNFNLVSSDSILNVQIRSLGYNSTNYKLVPSNLQSGLVLPEAETKETIAQNRKVVSSVSRKDSADIEEPEVGWGNYNTYVANNIQIPETVRAKNKRNDVELSFDIDKTGQPINIKVTRSSQCKECDEEAKRLLMEGPKWKRKGKKSKATISIAVDQK